MPWKMDGDKIAIESGNPVWVHDDGKEVSIDGGHVTQKIVDLTKENSKFRSQAREAQEKLEAFDGLDVEAARKALNTVKNLDDKKLIDAGEVERIKSEIAKAKDEQYKPVVEELKTTKEMSYRKDLEMAFATSELVSKKLIVPRDMVQKTFGDRFKHEDGKLVAYDETGNKIYSREKPGELAGFDEALTTLIDRYPHKASILADSGHTGGGAIGGGGGGGTGRTMKVSDFNNLAPKEQAAFMAAKGALTE